MAGLLEGQPEYGNQLGSQPIASNLFDKRAGLLHRTADGQPLSPQEVAQSDMDAATVIGEARKGLRRFGFSTMAATQGFAGSLIEPFAPETGRGLIQSGLRTAEAMPNDLRPAVENWSDVHNARTGALKIGSAFGEGAPSAALAVGAGLGGRLAGGAMAAARGLRGAAAEGFAARTSLGAGVASMLPMEGGETALELAQDPVAMANTSAAQRTALMLGRGSVNAALENVVPQALVVPQLLGKAARIRPGLGAGLRNTALLAGEGALGEYGTEAAQELTGQFAQNIAHPGMGYDLRKAHEAGLSGAVVGTALGGVGGAAQSAYSNVAEGIDKVQEGVEKAKTRLPDFGELVGHVQRYINDPAAAGAALADGTLFGAAKAAEAAGVLKDLGIRGINTAEEYASRTYDTTAKFIASRIDDPAVRQTFAEQAAGLKTMGMPEWEQFKAALSAQTGEDFQEHLGAAGGLLAGRAKGAWSQAKQTGSWIKDAANSYYDRVAEGAKGQQAHISGPDAADREAAVDRLLKAVPSLGGFVKAQTSTPNAKRDFANFIHFMLHDASYFESDDPQRVAALKDWADQTGTDLRKVLASARGGRNDEDYAKVAATRVNAALNQMGVKPSAHAALQKMVKDVDSYEQLLPVSKQVLFDLAGKNELSAISMFNTLAGAAREGQERGELVSGEAGMVGSQIPGMMAGAETGTIVERTPGTDMVEGDTMEQDVAATPATAVDSQGNPWIRDSEGNLVNPQSELESPFTAEAFAHSLQNADYSKNPGTFMPVTLQPQGEHANLPPLALANAFGRRVGKTGKEKWVPYKPGEAQWTKKEGLQLNINPMSLTKMVRDERFREQFAEHIPGFEDRPGSSKDEFNAQGFMNALATLASKGLHIAPEKVGLPAGGPPVRVKVNMNLAHLKDNLIINQFAGNKHKLTWADVSGKTKAAMSKDKHLARLTEFGGKFDGAAKILEAEGDAGNLLSEKISGVLYGRAKGRIRRDEGLEQGEPSRNPTYAERDQAAKEYFDALPKMKQDQKNYTAMKQQAEDVRAAFKDGILSEDDVVNLANFYSSTTGKNKRAAKALATINEPVLDRKAMDTTQLSQRLLEDMREIQLGQEAFAASTTGSDLAQPISMSTSILLDWMDFKYSIAQRAQRSHAANLDAAAQRAPKPIVPSKNPPEVGKRMTVSWNIKNKQLNESAAKYIITHVTPIKNGFLFSFRNEEDGKEYKGHRATAEGVSLRPGDKTAYRFTNQVAKEVEPGAFEKPAPAKPAAPATPGVAAKVAAQLQRLLDQAIKAAQAVIDKLPEARRAAAQAKLKDLHAALTKGLEGAEADIDKLLTAKKATPNDLIKQWEAQPQLAALKTIGREEADARDEEKTRTSPERYAEIKASTPVQKVSFLNTKKTYSHQDLNQLLQNWATTYLPNTPITLHVYKKQAGDPRGFVAPDKPGVVFLADEHEGTLGALSTLAHEFGHQLQYNAYNQASKAVKQSIQKRYKADLELLRSGKMTTEQALATFSSAATAMKQKTLAKPGEDWLGRISPLSKEAAQGKGPISESADTARVAYQASFGEWFANQFSRYVTSGVDTSLVPAEQKFWKRLIKAMKEFFTNVVKKMEPAAEFKIWVEGLAASARDNEGDEGPPSIPVQEELPPPNEDEQEAEAPPPPKPPEAPPPPPPGTPPPKKPRLTKAQKKVMAYVKHVMGNKVEVRFNQKLAGGVEGTFQTKLEKLASVGKKRDKLVDELRDQRALKGPHNQDVIDSLKEQIEELQQLEKDIIADKVALGFIEFASGMEKKAGLAEHEVFHAAFKIFFDAEERRILGMAFSRGLAGRRLREIFKDDPVVLKRINESSEEAAAYAFEVWAADPSQFQLGSQVRNMFERFLKFVRDLLGLMTLEEKAEVILNHLQSGQRLETALSPVARKLDKDLAWQERAQNMAKDVGGLLKQGFDILLGPTAQRLKGTNNPAINSIVERGYQATGEEGNAGGMVQQGRVKYRELTNRLSAIFKDLTEAELKTLHGHMVHDTPTDDPRVAALRQWYKDMYQYQVDAGVRLNDAGIKKGYYPLTWSPEKVLKNKKEFIDMLEKNYHNEFLTAKKTPNEVYNSITSYIDRGEDLVDVMGSNKEPLSESAKHRTLAFIKLEHREPFMDEDPIHTAHRYAKQAVRQAEYVRAFGMNGSKLTALKTEAETKYGATAEDIALVNDYIDGLLGNKEIGMSRELKDLYGAMSVYQNYRLLPFSLFASLVDPLGIAIRTGRAGDAWDTFIYSMKNLFKEWKSEYTRDYWEQLAEDWGVIEHSGTSISATNLYDGITLRGTTKDLNDKLFKYNLLNGWIRNNTIMATKAAQFAIYRAADGKMGKDSERFMEELGLTKDDVHFDPANNRLLLKPEELEASGMPKKEAAETSEKLRNAMEKIVRQSLLNPSAAELPNWASNPYLLPIAHLKQFVFAFNATILDRIWHEAKQGNFKPAALATAYVPGMIAADFVKDMIAGFGEEPPYKKNWGLYDYFEQGVSRSGLTGTGQFFSAASEDVVRGGSGAESAIGPAAQQVKQGLKAFHSGDEGAIKNWMIRAVPLQPVFRQHLSSPVAAPA